MEKFNVSRVDGRDQLDGDKENARYFVLDYVNDPYAKRALMYYAYICQKDCPALSLDLWVALTKNGYEKENRENFLTSQVFFDSFDSNKETSKEDSIQENEENNEPE